MHWYENDAAFYQSECSSIRKLLPDVRISIKQGFLVLEGQFPVCDVQGALLRHYQLRVIFHQNYPQTIPAVKMLERGISPIADRHLYQNKTACLCLPHEVPSHFPEGITFELFWEKLLSPWLIGQAGYDQTGKWPFPARDHGWPGIVEGFAEMLGINDAVQLQQFIQLLIRKNPAKGHEPCPCGSGKKLRNCHSGLYVQVRQNLPDHIRKIYRYQLTKHKTQL